MDITTLRETLIDKLQTVHDPEFPLVDVWTMGLIYEIEFLLVDASGNHKPLSDEVECPNYEKLLVHLTMTFTTPACPMADMMQDMIRQAISEVVPNAKVEITVVFDPPRTPTMIKEEDVRVLFE